MNPFPSLHPKTAPCETACPAGIDVPRYVRQVRDGLFAEALETIRERIPFPLVCGYACFHPCEAKCGRTQYEGPVAIRRLKRVAAELAPEVRVPGALAPTGRRIAIVGSGPCGLTAAYYLALLGHGVTVFEAMQRTGGMLRYGSPAYRLPDAVIDADIRIIEATGVEIRTGQRIESADALRDEGYDAVLLASGAWRALGLGLPGEHGAAVLKGVEFLEAVNAGRPPAIGTRVVVVGGGDTAIDAARVSRRLGAEVVQVYRRARTDMPANAEDVEAAIAEGVKLELLAAPLRIEPGRVHCVRMAPGEPDADGRRRPQPVPGDEFEIVADTVILAVGQQASAPTTAAERASDGTIRAHLDDLATSVSGIFAGGDAVTGPSSIIVAIAHGRIAAASIDRFLGGDGDLERFACAKPAAQLRDAAPRGSAPHMPLQLPIASRLAGFALVEAPLDAEAASAEAGRCLSCDLLSYDVSVDAALCKDCGYCDEVCGLDVFARSDTFHSSGYRPYAAVHPDRCVGCLRCLYICPDFAITVSDLRSASEAA
jgi:NADPH-dependent glutamate synthase beta subunit-like oxidoreductase/NAD-dependent dihydropyrimidine dehydrogenase PreA subunit